MALKASEWGSEQYPIRKSDLDLVAFCPYAFYLKRVKGGIKESELPLLIWYARKPFVQNMIWNKRSGLFRDDGSIRYSSANNFANFASSNWTGKIKRRTFQNRRLVWRSNGNEKRLGDAESASNHVAAACENYYNSLQQEGYLACLDADRESPIYFHNKDFAFFLEGNKIVVRFDEIRKGNVIRNQWTRATNESKKKRDANIGITLQILAYSMLAANHVFRMSCGIDPETASHLEHDSTYLMPEVKYEIFNLIEGKVYPTSRDSGSIDALLDGIDTVRDMIDTNDFEPSHSSCWVCRFNVEVNAEKVICQEHSPKVRPIVKRR